MNKSTFARLAVLAAALLNQFLVTLGFEALPWSGDAVGEFFSTAFTVAAAALAYWKNASFTEAAIKSDEVMNLLKTGALTFDEVNSLLRKENGKR